MNNLTCKGYKDFTAFSMSAEKAIIFIRLYKKKFYLRFTF